MTVSRTRRRIDGEAHRRVLAGVVEQPARPGLGKGRTIGVDATTLEANAAMRSIVRRDTGESHQEYLERLAARAGLEAPDRAALRRMDRKRSRQVLNAEWVNPHEAEAGVARAGGDGPRRLQARDQPMGRTPGQAELLRQILGSERPLPKSGLELHDLWVMGCGRSVQDEFIIQRGWPEAHQ